MRRHQRVNPPPRRRGPARLGTTISCDPNSRTHGPEVLAALCRAGAAHPVNGRAGRLRHSASTHPVAPLQRSSGNCATGYVAGTVAAVQCLQNGQQCQEQNASDYRKYDLLARKTTADTNSEEVGGSAARHPRRDVTTAASRRPGADPAKGGDFCSRRPGSRC